MSTQTKPRAGASKPAKSTKVGTGAKPRRVLMNTPMKKYIVHHDPDQWNEDMVSAGETN